MYRRDSGDYIPQPQTFKVKKAEYTTQNGFLDMRKKSEAAKSEQSKAVPEPAKKPSNTVIQQNVTAKQVSPKKQEKVEIIYKVEEGVANKYFNKELAVKTQEI